MHSIYIGIGGNDDAVKPEAIHTFFNIESMLQKVEFFIFVHHFLTHPETIQGLTATLFCRSSIVKPGRELEL